MIKRQRYYDSLKEAVPVCNSSHFFVLPEEELSVLYPEISDFTGCVNLHTKQDSEQLRRAVFGAVSDERVAVSGLDDLVAELETGMWGELTYHFPALHVLLFAAALLLVQAVFSACAVRYTRRLSLVERIKEAD